VLNGELISRSDAQENQQAPRYYSNDGREQNGDCGSSGSELSEDWMRNSEVISVKDAVRISNPNWSPPKQHKISK